MALHRALELDLHNLTWRDLRAFVNAATHEPDGDPVLLEFDHLDTLVGLKTYIDTTENGSNDGP